VDFQPATLSGKVSLTAWWGELGLFFSLYLPVCPSERRRVRDSETPSKGHATGKRFAPWRLSKHTQSLRDC
jgi:hypothetical protein